MAAEEVSEPPEPKSNGSHRPRPASKAGALNKTRRSFSASFKRQMVARIKASSKSISALATDVAISESVLRRWVRDAEVALKRPRPGTRKHARGSHYPDSLKQKVVQARRAGKSVVAIVKQFGVSESRVYKWTAASAADKGTTKTRVKVTAAPESEPMMHALRDAMGYLTHATDEMYAQLRTARISEFEEYHTWIIAAKKRLQSAMS